MPLSAELLRREAWVEAALAEPAGRGLRNLMDRLPVSLALVLDDETDARRRAVRASCCKDCHYQPEEKPNMSPYRENALRDCRRVYYDPVEERILHVEGYTIATMDRMGLWRAVEAEANPLSSVAVTLALNAAEDLDGDDLAEFLETRFWGAEEEVA